MRGKTRGGNFAIWVKTLTNLFLHQWIRSAWSKNTSSLLPYPFYVSTKLYPHFSLYKNKFFTLKQKRILAIEPVPSNSLAIEPQSNSLEILPIQLLAIQWVLSLSLSHTHTQIRLWLGFCKKSNNYYDFVVKPLFNKWI